MSSFVTTARLQQFFTGLKSIFAPIAHASSGTSYGVGSTTNYGHVKLVTGDMNGASNADGEAPSKNHTHSQYVASSSLSTILADYATTDQLQTVQQSIAGVYKYYGTSADIPTIADFSNDSLIKVGLVFNISGTFTTTSDFVEGAGHEYEAGTNIVIQNVTTSQGEVTAITWDVLGGGLTVPETTQAEITTILAS